MTTELFQTIFIFSNLAIILLLSAIWKAKAACTCRVKVPVSAIAFITSLVIGFMFEFTDFNILISTFLFLMTLGSALYPRINYAGPSIYSIAFILLFAGFDIIGINDIFNLGLENISIFGALIAIVIMFLKKQENVVTVYLIAILLFFMTSTTATISPLFASSIILVVSAIAISISEVMMIFFKDKEETIANEEALDIAYFSAGLYSFGISLVPLILL